MKKVTVKVEFPSNTYPEDSAELREIQDKVKEALEDGKVVVFTREHRITGTNIVKMVKEWNPDPDTDDLVAFWFTGNTTQWVCLWDAEYSISIGTVEQAEELIKELEEEI